MPKPRTCLFLALVLALAAGRALAHDQTEAGEAGEAGGRPAWEDDDHSHDRARRASEGGQILTMTEILARIGTQAPGRVLDTELEDEDGGWIYEIKLLDPQGRLYELEIDAHDGRILRRWEGE
jgi:uncharacterized membrane protein YkoI